MEKKEYMSKWDELARELGADIKPESEKPPESVVPPAPSRAPEASPPLPPPPKKAPGWDSLAGELGLPPAPPEEKPAQPRQRSARPHASRSDAKSPGAKRHHREKNLVARNRVAKTGRRVQRRGETNHKARSHVASDPAAMVSAARVGGAVGQNVRSKTCKAKSKVKVSRASAVNARKADAESVAVAVVDLADVEVIAVASVRGVIVMKPPAKVGRSAQVVLKDKSGRNDRRDPSARTTRTGRAAGAQNAERDRSGQIAQDQKLNVRNASLNRRRHLAKNRPSQRQ